MFLFDKCRNINNFDYFCTELLTKVKKTVVARNPIIRKFLLYQRIGFFQG